ncbi:MAG TPA: hypothetical protein VMT03_14175 [Polyangia bacterium]|nr:hypothetical protein [Polyangia bacterium]
MRAARNRDSSSFTYHAMGARTAAESASARATVSAGYILCST